MEATKLLVLTPRVTILEEIRKVFLGYDVVIDHAEDHIQAVSLLAKYPYQGMILEESLPGVSGIEFSKRIKKKLKNLIVLLLIAEKEIRRGKQAIQSLFVDHVIVYPWRMEKARSALHGIFPARPLVMPKEETEPDERYVLQEDDTEDHLDPDVVKVVIKGIEDLPPLPDVVRKILRLVDDAGAGAKDLAKIITSEPSLTAKVLKITNSSFYGLKQQVTTISHAVVILGFNEVKNLVLGYSIFSNIIGGKGRENQEELDFWRHNIACGVAARALGMRMGYQNPEELFVVGLLHDIGKTVFRNYFTERYQEVLAESGREHHSLFHEERKLLGLTHADVGYWLARHWNLPPLVRDGIRFHHTPALAKKSASSFAPKLVPLVFYADIFSKLLGIGNGGDAFIPDVIQAEFFEAIGFRNISELCETVVSQVKLFEQSLGIFHEDRWKQDTLSRIKQRRFFIIDDCEGISPLEVILGIRGVPYKRLPFSKDVFLDMLSRDTDVLVLNLKDDAFYGKFIERLLFENPTPPPVIAFTQAPKLSDRGRRITYLRKPFNVEELWGELEQITSSETA